MESEINKVIDFAQKAHSNQVRKYTGDPYFVHLAEVASIVQSITDDQDMISAAYLHDTIEDTYVTAEILGELFPAEIVQAVVAITKIKGESYTAYLDRVKKNRLSRAVKLVDLQHNMMIERLPLPNERDFERVKKYSKAYEFLLKE